MSDNKKILIVDDSIIAAKTLINIITAMDNFEVVGHAKNGIEAIKMFQMHKPDIIAMDLVMPVMDGLQAIRAIKQLSNEVDILVVSSVGGVAAKTDEALKAGAKSVITKPFDKKIIENQLNSL